MRKKAKQAGIVRYSKFDTALLQFNTVIVIDTELYGLHLFFESL
jgi:hypothetical protein